MSTKSTIIEKIVVAVVASAIVAVVLLFIAILFGLPVMWLWNALMPDIFGLKEIGFLQAVGLFLLCGLLFKGHSSSKKSD